ncbi:LppX_LprAFG lipoprotein [Nocardioides coralli]|uniref:LppX_LprAFG lipoprotein n=1 Tax=Nocardioides coralli TaxID=2872154 RepID=UPI001CA40458|nr:LppX_LprAFG lipoprotein [Nocardioides coralli]QZY27865.1 LppX_LprAFG lipoprotein [Nocardioides coralli]
MRVRRNAAVLALALGLGLTGCSDDAPAAEERSPEEVLALAKTALDETSGVRITLDADQVPVGVTSISGAEGVGIHPPAFEGTLTAVLAGSEFEVPVVAVDGKVYAQIPLTPGWSDVDPADYGAPDPGGLMSTDEGLSSLLTATTGVEEGESVRGGADNDEVLTEYSGTVPGTVVSNVIPSASGDFDALYTVAADGELRSAELTGVFYPDTEPMTYTLTFDDYGVEQDITAP